MSKLNCWEFMKCGRHVEKDKTGKSDVCPVATEKSADGLNDGVNGGRICWIVADTCCNKWIPCQGNKRKDPCFSCEFRFKVMMEEGFLRVCEASGSLLQAAKTQEAMCSDTSAFHK
jgi:hypothetical protein